MKMTKRGIITIAGVMVLLLIHAICELRNELAFEKEANDNLMIEIINLRSELEGMHFDNQSLQQEVEILENEVVELSK